MKQITSISTVWIKAVVQTDNDPTFATVRFAVVTEGTEEPAEAQWVAGEWETPTPAPKRGDFYRAVARVKVGPGTLIGQLTNGRYDKWARVTSADEDVAMPFGKLTVT